MCISKGAQLNKNEVIIKFLQLAHKISIYIPRIWFKSYILKIINLKTELNT